MKVYFSRLGERLGVSLGPPEMLVKKLGYQYLQTGRSQLGISAFRFNVDQHRESANAWDSLAEGLERSGDLPEALASYRKAVAWAEAQHDPSLAAFRKHLSRLEAAQQKAPSH